MSNGNKNGCSILLMAVFVFFLIWMYKGCRDVEREVEESRQSMDEAAIIIREEKEEYHTEDRFLNRQTPEERRADSIGNARQRKIYFETMRQVGEHEKHKGGREILGSYEEGYEQGYQDRISGKKYDNTDYSSNYSEGYQDGYGGL